MDVLDTLWVAIEQAPILFVIAAILVFAAGVFAGIAARSIERLEEPNEPVDTHAALAADPSWADLQARRIAHRCGERPHARAGRSPLKPSYDGCTQQAVAPQPPDMQPRA